MKTVTFSDIIEGVLQRLDLANQESVLDSLQEDIGGMEHLLMEFEEFFPRWKSFSGLDLEHYVAGKLDDYMVGILPVISNKDNSLFRCREIIYEIYHNLDSIDAFTKYYQELNIKKNI